MVGVQEYVYLTLIRMVKGYVNPFKVVGTKEKQRISYFSLNKWPQLNKYLLTLRH